MGAPLSSLAVCAKELLLILSEPFFCFLSILVLNDLLGTAGYLKQYSFYSPCELTISLRAPK